MKIKVGVIFGGETVEHEVSIISAIQAMNNMNEDKYDIMPIYIAKDKTWYAGKMLMDINVYKDFNNLKRYAKKVTLYKEENAYYLQSTTGIFRKNITDLDVILPIVHGNNVEDGTLVGYLDTVGIPYVGSNVLASSLGQDKVVQKQVLRSEGLPVVDYTWFYDSEYLEDSEKILKNIKELKYPVIVKPATLGSSIGITLVKNDEKINEAINEAIKYDNKIIVEKVVENMIEVNASVLGNHDYQTVSPLEEVMGADEILSYTDKYIGSSKGSKSKGMASANRIIPARIDEKLALSIVDISKKVFRALNMSGVCRIDYLIDKKNNKFYINEPNTIPGSLAFYLWKESGMEYETLIDELISLAIKDYKNKTQKVRSFDSNILQNFNGTKGIKGLKK